MEYVIIAKILLAPFITYFYGTLIAKGHLLERLGDWLGRDEENIVYWKKPLGACLICFNIWLTIACISLPFNIVVYVGMVGISNYLIQKI